MAPTNNSKILWGALAAVMTSIGVAIFRQSSSSSSTPASTTLTVLTESQLQDAFQGKRVLVVGGTRGVGYGCALAMAHAGASHVTVVGRSSTSAEKALNKIRAAIASATDKAAATTSTATTPELDFVQGDIGTVQSALQLVGTLSNRPMKYDIVITTAAVFPDLKADTMLQEDGLDQSFAIAVLGRYILYKHLDQFVSVSTTSSSSSSPSPILLLHVLNGGQLAGFPTYATLDRDLVQGKTQVTTLFQSLKFWSLAADIMLEGWLADYSAATAARPITVVSTHPGMLKTDLHSGQCLWFDVLEFVSVALAGVSEEECGVRQASILAQCTAMDHQELSANTNHSGRIHYVSPKLSRTDRSPEIQRQLDDHQEWLVEFLNDKINVYTKAHDSSAGD